MSSAEPGLISLVIPTLNEALNLPTLCTRVAAALGAQPYEMRIIDDNSRDDTKQVCAALACTYPLHLTTREKPRNGLSGAVLAGMAEARGDMLVCMDADLQHPPEKILALVAPLINRTADFVIGSRYVEGGTTIEEWGAFRKINSRVATLLARPFSGPTRDPMSGFFALRRDTYLAASDLTPLGYKIGLELMCKCRVKQVAEVPIDFAMRERGQSKLSIKEQFRYLEHLSRLYDFQYPRASAITKFALVAGVSWLFGLAIVLVNWSIDRPILLTFFAYACTLGVTMVFLARYIRTQREFIVGKRPWMSFGLISLAELLTVWLTSVWLHHHVSVADPIEFWSIAFCVALGTRYVLRKELLQDLRGLRRNERG